MIEIINKLINKVKQKVYAMRYHNFDNFVYIHINKTGGSSIEKALSLPFEHKTAQGVIDKIGRDKWDDKFTFTVIRNPWDRAVSHYHYRVQTNTTTLGDNPIGFKEWVKRTYRDQDPLYYENPRMFLPQIEWITDKEGNILVDEIVRFENLNEEFGNIAKILGKNVRLPHVKASDRGNYKDYYDEETIQIIEDWFKRDIEIFEYKF